MASSPSFLCASYRGAVYPVDLHAAPTDVRVEIPRVETLVALCAEKIVQDSDLTRHAIHKLPKPLRILLMMEALFKNNALAVRCILGAWHIPDLLLHDLVPPLFTSIQPLYNTTYQEDIVEQGCCYTTSLVHAFLEIMKSRCDSNLKVMDLRGFPTEEKDIYSLATHCVTAHIPNDVRHEPSRNMHENAVQEAGNDDVSHGVGPMEHSLPQDCSVTIKLDAFLTSKSTHIELCKALKVSSFHNPKLNIMIGRLAMTCLGQARISLLLKQLHPQHLTGLQLQYNALTAKDFVKMAPALKSLVCLESLDLSCNRISFHQNETACIDAAQVFGCMPKLCRLDLSNNCIETCLQRLLESITVPLKCLRLVGCSLTETDMKYLAHSIHSSELRELDLSANNFGQCDLQFGEVITASKSSLCVLEVEDCFPNQANITNLCPSLSQLSSLMYVNFSENRLPQGCQESLLATMAELVTLQVFKSSYALECYEGEGDKDRLKVASCAKLNLVINKSSVQSRRPKPLMLFLTELK